jgi:S1-C subfamily serine protease
VTAQRNGRDQDFRVALTELPDRPREDTEQDTSTSTGTTGNTKYGLTVQPLTADTANRYNLDATDQGLLVTKVDPTGSAADAGMRQGDLIEEVNRQPVKTVAEFSAALRQSGARPALVLVKRRENVIYMTLKADS